MDGNSRQTLTALSSANDGAIVQLWADPTTHALLVDTTGVTGMVTSVSVVTANGFAGTVATATTTPAITITTTVTGVLYGNGTSVAAATGGQLPVMTATVGGAVPTPPNNTTTFLRGDGTFAAPAGGGDVVGPASATDNAVARFDGTTGKLIQNSAVTIADTSGNITGGTYNGNTIGVGSTSGTNTGDQTSVTGNAGTATALQTGRTIGTATGDVTSAGSSFDGTANNTNAYTLATVNSNVGSFTSANITVNAKGLITAASNGTAPTPTVITVANEATDTTCFPAFFTAATGDLGPKTNTGLTFNSNTSLLTSTLIAATTSVTSASILASSNDSGALGASGTAFSDLFLATGGVINWNAGNATLTHSTSLLTSNVALALPNAGLIIDNADTGVGLTITTESAAGAWTATFPAITGTVTLNAAAQTITSKRIQPRTASSTTSSNLSPDLSTANVYYRTTQTATLTIDAPTGTPVIGETIMMYIDSAGAQTLNMNATYIPFGAAFPATTTAGKTLMISAQYNGTNWKTLWANAV